MEKEAVLGFIFLTNLSHSLCLDLEPEDRLRLSLSAVAESRLRLRFNEISQSLSAPSILIVNDEY